MKKRIIETLLFALLLIAPQLVFSAPALINYQGVLTSMSGRAVTGPVTMIFKIWDSETNGTNSWSETHTGVTLQNGVYNVVLGSVNTDTLTPDLFADDDRWLEVTVNDETLTPRQKLTSVVYSYNADMLDGLDSSALQKTVTGTCATGSSISSINSDGTVTCETDDVSAGGSTVWSQSGSDVYYNNGNVGLGTTTPGTKLDVAGTVTATAFAGDGTGLTGIIGEPGPAGASPFGLSGSAAYYNNGNVGIGTMSPATTLDINGTMRLAENSSEPYPCDAEYRGAIALTSAFTTCVCTGTAWVSASDGTSDCEWLPEGLVMSAGSRIWMDRNFGASQVATSSTDAAAYGDLYQWGRDADGHQLRGSATTSTTSSADDPGHGNFIATDSSPYDWRVPQNDTLWQGVSGINNPCPAGFRLPTNTELDVERASWSSQNSAGAFNSPLKLVTAGNRGRSNGTLDSVGSYGLYWSSTVDGASARNLYFYSGYANMDSNHRAYGFSVRCLED